MTIESVLEAAYSTDAGAAMECALAEPINGLGIPSAPILLNPATSGADGPLFGCVKSQPGI